MNHYLYSGKPVMDLDGRFSVPWYSFILVNFLASCKQCIIAEVCSQEAKTS